MPSASKSVLPMERHDHHVLFNGWASEVNSKFVSAGGYTIDESDEAITIAKGNVKLVLNKADFAKPSSPL